MCVYVHTSTYEISSQFIRSKEVIFLLLIILTFPEFLRMNRTDPKPMTTTNFSCTDSIHNDQPTVSAPNRNIFWQSLQQLYPPGFLKKVVAEIIATFLLVFVTCGSAAISAADQHRVSRLGASVAGGLIVTVMIYAVGHISGAHMNPAVTIAFAAVRHFPWKQVPVYAAAQLTGAIGASFTLAVLLHPIENIGTTTPSGTHIQALIMEVVVTFSMMFITSAVATDTKAIGELAGIAVGSAVCITSILAGPVSGGSMNPARTIGPALASSCYKDIWVYIIGPIAGTLLGAWSYNLIRVSDKPVHELTSGGGSVSFKLRRMMSNAGHVSGKQPLNSV